MVKLISVQYIGNSSENLNPVRKIRAKYLAEKDAYSLPTSFTEWSSIVSCVVTALEFASYIR